MVLPALALALAPRGASGWPEKLRGEAPVRGDLRYRIWLDPNEHFRVAFSKGDGEKLFAIRVVTDGHVDDAEARGPEGEKLQVERGGMRLKLKTRVRSGWLRFEVEGGSRLTLFLRYDRRPVPVSEIGLGRSGEAPSHNPVSFKREKATAPTPEKHSHAKGEHHHHEHAHPHDLSDHHHHPHDHPHPITHGHHPH